jgi:hypothetical protein
MTEALTDSRLRTAIRKLLAGQIDEVMSDLGPTADDYVVSLMLALLGVCVRQKFGRNSPVSQLASYAQEIQESAGVESTPPLWMVESILRAGVGNSLLFSQLGSESSITLYEGVGLTLGFLLSDLAPDLRMRDRLTQEVIGISRPAFEGRK